MDSFYFDGVTTDAGDWEMIIERYVGRDSLSDIDDEVWKVAKKSVEVPHMGNIYQTIVQEKLAAFLLSIGFKEEDIEYWANGTASAFKVYDEDIGSIFNFRKLIKKKEQLKKAETEEA